MISFVAASGGHVGRVAHRLRDVDRRECEAKGRSAKTSLRLALRASEWAVTALVDGVPHAMFGIAPLSLIEDSGRPWFLGSDEVYQQGREMLVRGLDTVAFMHRSFARLENVVSADNVRAIRLLRRWGFTVEGEVQMVGNVPFVRFWKDAGDV